jgi:hypothetical protein
MGGQPVGMGRACQAERGATVAKENEPPVARRLVKVRVR